MLLEIKGKIENIKPMKKLFPDQKIVENLNYLKKGNDKLKRSLERFSNVSTKKELDKYMRLILEDKPKVNEANTRDLLKKLLKTK